ncbi:hypothetical protein AG0111_0g7357 [Alternaria gaisen]|uniref:Uncharacterized protein n=1 Tax=Alternaria gaisen TaxID=167740 RepID=A0ACB6FJ76_9PLEO|nr:hypothetical protein AG0111_0g7357 [Alternaria gaisen]
MHFTLPLLALAASVSASNPIEAAWNVTRSYRDISQQVVAYDLTAVFVSEEYPKGLESKCNWSQKGMQFNVVCDPDTFSVEPQTDGTLKIQQTIEKPTKQVVYGQGDVPAKGHVVVPVTARVA